MKYPFREIEDKWRKRWESNHTFGTTDDPDKPTYYVLDMFPYPSGEGLHVGHLLGYVASDIVARYKRHRGCNVLHPMGFDSFGLPAEQFAIKTGQHPRITTRDNISTYKKQLRDIGLSFDWEREVQTSDPDFYQWTQWIFIQLFHSYYDTKLDKACSIEGLIQTFEKEGNKNTTAYTTEYVAPVFSAEQWNEASDKQKEDWLQNYRLAYLSTTFVNWCPKMGTILANDEVKDGYSVIGGFPIQRKEMPQWSLRITAYAERLLQGLETIDWSEGLKNEQRNWIRKSKGAVVFFKIEDSDEQLTVFTTRPDTLYGVTYMTMSPEHPLVNTLTTEGQKEEVEAYIKASRSRSELDRLAKTKTVSGAFTGSYVIHPLTGERVPIWLSDYVIMGYGTGAVMAVPAHDERDYRFAKHFGIEIRTVIKSDEEDQSLPIITKGGKVINSPHIDGMNVPDAIKRIGSILEEKKAGREVINYRLRDAAFGRQRYWGEPIPIYYDDEGTPHTLPTEELPLILPEIEKYKPTEDGQPPLDRATDWRYKDKYKYETTTMPGWAGSSWYFLRYMDASNSSTLVSQESETLWKNVDFYLGGKEHAVGHLLYSRFWHKFLYDIGKVQTTEPFKKLVNQGMIGYQVGVIYSKPESNNYYTQAMVDEMKENEEKLVPSYIHVSLYDESTKEVDIERLRQWQPEFRDATYEMDNDGKFYCETQRAKMSKSKFNVVNPQDIIEKYSADTLRIYEMFLGPIRDSKPWSEKSINGCYNFLCKLWRLFHRDRTFSIDDESPTDEECKVLHRTIKNITEGIEKESFNTCVSTFMICVNDLQSLNCHKREILEPLLILLSPFTPFVAEELWELCGYEDSISHHPYPTYDPKWLVEDQIEYPVMINGKKRLMLSVPADRTKDELKAELTAHERVMQYTSGKPFKKFIFVPNKIINIVV